VHAIEAYWLGRIPYKDCWDLQLALHSSVIAGRRPSTLLLLEHDPVITVGRHGDNKNIYLTEEQLAASGVSLFHIERGGDATFHGPGQLVGYPILNLKELGIGVSEYLRLLEESLIMLLAEYGIETRREDGYTGVWHEKGKVAAIGIAVKRWATYHGFALNVATDLDYFRLINPCGLSRPVTSIKALTGKDAGCITVAQEYLKHFNAAYRHKCTELREYRPEI
jgi:lipoyl(octanoyl) transferase